MARHRRPQPSPQHAQHRATQEPTAYHPGPGFAPPPAIPHLVPLPHTAPPGTQSHRAGRSAVRASVLHRVALPAATVLAVGVVTVGVTLAVGKADGPSMRPASGSTAGTTPVTSVEPLAPTGSSMSSVTPSAQDVVEIATAVRTSPFTSDVPPNDYEVTGTKLAASDPSWAWTQLRPKVADLDGAVGVLHETGGQWVLVQLGSYEVGCDVTPPQVREDLDLVCPTSSGPVVDA